MATILRVDSSARRAVSHSRATADLIEQAILRAHPDWSVTRRDVAAEPLEHLRDETIQGFYTPADQFTDELAVATALSDQLIAELMSAETLIVSAPIYNFSMPSSLKAWVDQVMRIGRTFSYGASGFSGLVPMKTAYLALSYGGVGYAEGGDFASMNFLEPYLISLLKFMGIDQVHTFRTEGTTGAPDWVAAEGERVAAEIAEFFHN